MDIYLYSMRVSRLQELERNPDIRMVRAPSLLLSLILNPAPDPRGLNPFSIKEVRQAFQYLVNRDYVTRELYRGLASPMTTHLTPYDYDYATFFEAVTEAGIKYDPEYAGRRISEALNAAGAVKRDGKWYFKDRPVSVKFVIRTEDERRELGDLIASELEKLGFTVERIYAPSHKPLRGFTRQTRRVPVAHLHRGLGEGRAGEIRHILDKPVLRPMAGKHAGLAGVRLLAVSEPATRRPRPENIQGDVRKP
jgi:hypothetical protein